MIDQYRREEHREEQREEANRGWGAEEAGNRGSEGKIHAVRWRKSN